MSLTLTSQPHYICPICRSILDTHEKSFICENHHCFDIAKEGYVNLLPVQQKKSKNPGDNKIMIQSRQDFLNKHYYDCLIQPCAEIINKHILERFENSCLVDVGCGDGFFTHHINNQLTQTAFCYGMDISKEAVKFSAKRDKSIYWMVASCHDIPLADNSIDIMLKINAPLNYENSRYKLSQKGIVVSVTPGESHLNGLKSYLYETPQDHEKEPCPENYQILDFKQVNGKIHLKSETDIKNLFMMTPFFWNASQKSKDKINDLQNLESDISFNIHVWEKK